VVSNRPLVTPLSPVSGVKVVVDGASVAQYNILMVSFLVSGFLQDGLPAILLATSDPGLPGRLDRIWSKR